MNKHLSGLPVESSTLVELLRWRAIQQPEQQAYTFLIGGEEQGQHLTYGELDCQARAVAALLQDFVEPGQRALLLYPPGLEFISAFFGCLYAGIVAVPAYPPSFNRPTPRLQAIVQDAQAKVVLTTTQVLSNESRLFTHHPYLKALQWLATNNGISGLEKNWQETAVIGDTLAFLQYTSGSTSTPKGVMVSHRNILHNQRLIQTGFGHTDKSIVLGWLPLFHDMGLIGNVLQPLYLGAPCILMPPVAFLQNPLRWLHAISRYKATTSGGPNFAYELCVSKITPQQRESLDLSSWEVAFNGAEHVRPETLERFAETFASCGFRQEAFYPCYGMAETTLIVSGGQRSAPPVFQSVNKTALQKNRIITTTEDDIAHKLVGCGQPLGDLQVVIVHPETLTRCSPDEVGEIWVSGPSVAGGYWNRPEETKRTFCAYIQNPKEGPFLRTGDRGFLQRRELFITGRLKDLIIIRGRNHYPQDIELTVEHSHEILQPYCSAAFTVDVASEERLVVVVEVKRSYLRDFNLEEVVGAIRQAVAEKHELQVYGIMLLKVGSIPKTSSGKIQRHACHAGFLNNSLDVVGSSILEKSYVTEYEDSHIREDLLEIEPKDYQPQLESYLQKRVVQVLRGATSQLDTQQPLSTVGLDSLMAVELKNTIETDLGVVLPMTSFLQGDCIAQLANELSAQLTASPANQQTTFITARESQIEQPLSYGQRALWFLHKLAPKSLAYNIVRAVRLQGELVIPALQRAFQKLVDRHSSLRTTFTASQGEAVQRICDYTDICFQQEEVFTWSEAFLKERINAEAQRPFNLEQGPLMRVNLFTCSPQEHILLLSVHHIIIDFWSLAVLVQELGILYRAEKDGISISLAPLTLQYTDYCCWQAEMLANLKGKHLWEYWQQQLAGELLVLNLPTDRPRPPIQTYRGASVPLKLSAELTQRLKLLSRTHGATLYTTLLAAFQVLLHRYTGQEDILVGSPTTGRSGANLSGLVGYFTNPVVLRANLSQNLTFVAFLEQVRQTVLDAFTHQDYPFALLVERLKPVRDASRAPLFQTMFILHKAHLMHEQGLTAFALNETGAKLHLGGLEMESFALEQKIAQFDLTLMMAELDGELAASFEFNADLFTVATITQMSSCFQTLLESIVANPQQRLSDLPLLTKAKRHQLLVEWNDTQTNYPQKHCLHELFEAQVKRNPEAIATVFEDKQLTYRDLNRQANQLAHYLRTLGVGPEVLVGICVERSIEMVVGLLGILKAGGAYVPLDPAYPQDRLAYMLNDSQILVLLTQEKLVTKLREHEARVICLDTDWGVISRQGQENPVSGITPENLIYVIYTSGSTGKPKGVTNTHRGICNRLLWMQDAYQLASTDRILQKTPFSFDVSVWEFFWPLLIGSRLVMAKPDGHQDSSYLVDLIAEQGITTLHFVPSMLKVFLEEQSLESCSCLKQVICSGEALPFDLQERFFARLGCELHNLYGPTEAAIDVTFWQCKPESNLRTVPIGRPIANTQIYILDNYLQPVPIGVPGELYIGGAGLARGYFNRPDLTAEKFIPNPFNSELGSRLYKTGDLTRYLPDGNIEFLGRIDHQVKIRGFRIELGEIEELLLQHSTVRETVVIVREDQLGNQRIVAYIVPNYEQAHTTSNLRHFLKEKLPNYMVPATFVMLKALPLTPNGKVDRRALPAPEWVRPELETGFVEPSTLKEKLLAGIWAEVIGIKQIGIYDNFFDLGGDSIRSIQVLSKAKQIGLNFSLEQLFQCQTIYELACLVRYKHEDYLSTQKVEAFSLICEKDRLKLALDVEDSYPLAALQLGMLFHSEYSLDTTNIYHDVFSYHIRASLDIQTFHVAIQQLVNRHAVLRTSFKLTGLTEPLQLVHRKVNIPLHVEDLRHLSNDEQEAAIDAWIEAEKKRHFDWSTPPLLRFQIHLRTPGTFNFTLSFHHSILDGWSVASMMTELFQQYLSLLNENNYPPQPRLTSEFRDFIALEKLAVKSEECQRYWAQKLRDTNITKIPRWSKSYRSDHQTGKLGELNILLSPDVSGGLKKLATVAGTPLKSVLLAAHLRVLSLLCNLSEVVTGLPFNGRLEETDGERVLGLFLNTLPFRLKLLGGTWIDLVQETFKTEQELLPFRRYPLAELQRTLGGQPLFETVFGFNHFHIYKNIQGFQGLEVLGGQFFEQTNFMLGSHFNLDLFSSHINLTLKYDAGELCEEQVKTISSYYAQTLRTMVRQPSEQYENYKAKEVKEVTIEKLKKVKRKFI